VDEVAAAQDAFTRKAWSETRRLLSAGSIDTLAADDLERLAVASYLIGCDDDAVAAWEQAYRRRLDAGEQPAAAQCAFWAALCLMLRGQMAQAGGWLSRTKTTIGERDCAASGYLLIPALLGALDSGDGTGARDLAVQAVAIADRFDDRDLRAVAVLGHGQALLALGDPFGATTRFDEVMLSVRSGEVGPIVSGIVYCAVILECIQMFDVARAAEWTAALDTWCAAQPDLVPYRGQCLVHKSQLQQAAGDWSKAATTVASACERLSAPPHPALGLACYQEAELLRLRGALDAAAEAYGRASRAGYEPMPGLALLEQARGDEAAAVASIRRVLLETAEPFRRPPLLAAAVDILVAAGQPADAGDAATELAAIAGQSTSPMLHAMAEQAKGSVAMAVGDPTRALPCLRAASQEWRRLHMPYEGARAALLLGRACLALGDRAAAELEFDNARQAFAALQARIDLEALAALTGSAEGGGRLSRRELEVLTQVAEGKTNREIAGALSISAHTVGRHLENIFAKTGTSGRAAATAWAYEHDLL